MNFIQSKVNYFEFDSEETKVLYQILLINDNNQTDLLINSFNFNLKLMQLKFNGELSNFTNFYTEQEHVFVKSSDINCLKNKEAEIFHNVLKDYFGSNLKKNRVKIPEFAMSKNLSEQMIHFFHDNNYVFSYGNPFQYYIKVAKVPVGIINSIKLWFWFL